jgi:hypothetical protein
MQKIADISTYNFQNQPLVLGMIIFGIVAMLASLVITIHELPKAEYPHYMMSNFIISKESWWTASISWGLAYCFYSIVVIKKMLAGTGEGNSTQIPQLEKIRCFCCLISSLSLIGVLAWDIEDNPILHRIFGGLWAAPGTISTGLRVWFLDDTAQNTWGNLARKINFYGELICSVPIALGMTVLHADDSFLVSLLRLWNMCLSFTYVFLEFYSPFKNLILMTNLLFLML